MLGRHRSQGGLELGAGGRVGDGAAAGTGRPTGHRSGACRRSASMAQFRTMLKSHEPNFRSPRNPLRKRKARRNASWVTSSASWRSRVRCHAKRNASAWNSRTRSSNARRSPRRARCTVRGSGSRTRFLSALPDTAAKAPAASRVPGRGSGAHDAPPSAHRQGDRFRPPRVPCCLGGRDVEDRLDLSERERAEVGAGAGVHDRDTARRGRRRGGRRRQTGRARSRLPGAASGRAPRATRCRSRATADSLPTPTNSVLPSALSLAEVRPRSAIRAARSLAVRTISIDLVSISAMRPLIESTM